MNNKECVLKILLDIQKNNVNKIENFKGVQAEDISNILKIQRNVVSKHLNELVRDGIVVKSSTRPVYFKYIGKVNVFEKAGDTKQKDPFINFIGFDNSLSKEVEQCKSATIYPSKSMSILLLGESGVGKSYMAEIIYKYAKYKFCIPDDAPFIVLNCADYANNPELLSACLFGYKKGAFTGADRDKKGLIEEAHRGYLFLDEVHRLPPEGQEKLFVFLDKGIFKRIGSNEDISNIKVKCIFATTENPKEVLLDTFLRRIPVRVKLPNFIERPIEERLSLIYQFYYEEAKNVEMDFRIRNRVINTLLFSKQNGNIGELKDVIRFSCANSYRRNINEDIKEITIKDLPDIYLLQSSALQSYYNNEYLNVIRKSYNNFYSLSNKWLADDIFSKIIEKIYKEINGDERNQSNKDNEIKLIRRETNSLISTITFNSQIKENELLESIYLDNVSKSLEILNSKYGIKYYGNTAKILAKFLLQLRNENHQYSKEETDKSIYVNISTYLKKNYSKMYIITGKFIAMINSALDCNINLKGTIIIALYFISVMINKKNEISAILVAHGFSTASSIASLTNKVYEEFIFESFDMPIEMSPKEIIKKITSYIKSIDTKGGVVILVDMGSLFNMGEEIKKVAKGDIGIINNITTQVALDVGGKILNNENIEKIINSVEEGNKIQSQFIKNVEKKKAIITTCISGMGTATKIKDLMKICLEGNEIEVIACDYRSLMIEGKEHEIFKYYEVQLVISTLETKIQDLKCILLQDLIEEKGEKELKDILISIGLTNNLNNISSNIIKYFSMENIINQLTILNANKIINDVEIMLQILEMELDCKFTSQLTMILYIHISLLVERLITGRAIVYDEDYLEFRKGSRYFIEAINKSFLNIEKQYNIKINITEINLLYQIIESTLGDELLQKSFCVTGV